MSILIGLTILIIIVTIHELGHFLVAKRFGISVEEFAVGIGPKLYSKMWKDTLWSIRILPLGGFCRLKSTIHTYSNPQEYIPTEEGTFHAASFLKKIMVLLGGPGANIASYILFSFLVFLLGGEEYELKPYIEPYVPPATESDLQIGDEIVAINNIDITSFSDLSEASTSFAGQEVLLSYKRDGILRSSSLRLNASSPALGVYPYIAPVISNLAPDSIAYAIGLQNNDIIVDINGTSIENAVRIPAVLSEYDTTHPAIITVTRNGVQRTFEIISQTTLTLEELGIRIEYVKTTAWDSFGEFFNMKFLQATRILLYTFAFLGDIATFNTRKIMENTAGPIQLISIVGTSTLYNASEHGILFALMQLLNTTAILSIAIAALNLLPIPVLDGGQIVFYTFYRLIRKRPRTKSLYYYNAVGSILLLFLFGLIIFSDITSIF